MEPLLDASQVAVDSVVGKLRSLLASEFALVRGVRNDIQYINDELGSMQAFLNLSASGGARDHDAQTKDWMKQIRDVAYDVEDCLDDFMRPLPDDPQGGLRIRELWTRDIAEIVALKWWVQQIGERRNRYVVKNPEPLGDDARHTGFDAAEPSPLPVSSTSTLYRRVVDLVDMKKQKVELLELLQEKTKYKDLRVISIVGCHGMGKATLAMQVYNSDYAKRFSCRAWVDTSNHHSSTEFITEILREFTRGASTSSLSSSSAAQPIQPADLRSYLQEKQRFFVVLVNIHPEIWETVKAAFPIDSDGRIIVTTSVNSVAMQCSFRGGSVYQMQALEKSQCEALFWKIVPNSPREFQGNLDIVSKHILAKCAGVPLAIVGVAQILKDDMLNSIKDVSKEKIYLRSNPIIERLKQEIIHSYQSLHPDLRMCFLSLCVFPEGHEIKMKGLTRRWSAERKRLQRGTSDHYNEYRLAVQELVDRNLIKSVKVSYNGTVKAGQINGIIFDFIVHHSMKGTNSALIHNDKLLGNSGNVRRLSFHSINAKSQEIARGLNLSRIRSFSIFNPAVDCIHLVDIQDCKLIRVLDIEKCTGLTRNILDGICELPLLTYLSLRDTDAASLPPKISKLHFLQTLDIRGTKINMLLIEVLTLPRLVNLFGEFGLPRLGRRQTNRKLLRFFSQYCNLETLSGFLIDGSPTFELIMTHLRKLRKIKMLSTKPHDRQITDTLVSCLQKRFHNDLERAGNDQSLAIDFGNESLNFLEAIKGPCFLASLKLRGSMARLPGFILSSHLVELCLSSTGLRCEDISVLQTLHGLKYLKLVGQELRGSSLNIASNGFRYLLRLWIEADHLPQLNIEEGGMHHLTCLQLLCNDVGGLPMPANTIQLLRYLSEITLGRVTVETEPAWKDAARAWKDAAKHHPSRPMIKLTGTSD